MREAIYKHHVQIMSLSSMAKKHLHLFRASPEVSQIHPGPGANTDYPVIRTICCLLTYPKTAIPYGTQKLHLCNPTSRVVGLSVSLIQ